MAAPSGCIELRLEGSSAPRVLRGGSQVACCRSTCSESLEQQFEHSMRRLTGDPRRQGSRGLLGDLEADVPPALSRCSARSSRDNNPGDMVALHAVSKKLLLEGFLLVRDALELYACVKIEFLEKLRSSRASHADIHVPTKTSLRNNVKDYLLSSLSVLQVAVRLRDVKANGYDREDWGLALLPNPVAMTEVALQHHLVGFYKMYDDLHARKARFEVISPAEFETLRSLVPAEATALVDFLLTKVGAAPAVLASLGITPNRAASVNLRFHALVSETSPRIRERLTKSLALRLGVEDSDVSLSSVRAVMRRTSLSASLLKNSMLGAAARLRRVSSQMPELCQIMQNAAREAGGMSKTGCDDSYGTPTDAIIFEAAWGASGGMVDRLTAIAQHYLAANGLTRQQSAIRKALREYEIRFNQVKHSLAPVRVEKYYCASRIKAQKQFAALFSAWCRRLSCDASKLFRCDALSNAGGAWTMTVEADTVQGPDHDCGGDHKSKLGAFGVLTLPSLEEDLDPTLGLFPVGFDPAVAIPGWSKDTCTAVRAGVACVLGHVEREGGETAARNWQDRLENIVTYQEDFLTQAGDLVPVYFFEEDNAKGVRDKTARFCLVAFADVLGADYVDDASHAAGNSKYHAVEAMWGATRFRTGGPPIMLDVPHWESSTELEKLEASRKALKTLMERYDGATCETGGGIVNANVAGAVATDFVFRDDEIKRFMALNTGTGFNGFAPINKEQLAFVAEAMPGFDGKPADVYRRVWRKMTAAGDEQCFFVCLNSMTYASNPLNLDCAARRTPAVFWDCLKQFSTSGLCMPQGVPSTLRPGKLMRLDERIASAASTSEKDNRLDQHNPVRKLGEIEAEMHFVSKACTGDEVTAGHLAILAKELCVDVADVEHHFKVAVYKNQRKVNRDSLRGDLKESGSTLLVAAFVRRELGLAEVTPCVHVGKLEPSASHSKGGR